MMNCMGLGKSEYPRVVDPRALGAEQFSYFGLMIHGVLNLEAKYLQPRHGDIVVTRQHGITAFW